MDGAVYVLSRDTAKFTERSTNRKPDGLWFDGKDEHGRNVQHQYRSAGVMPLVDCKEPITMEYRYDGQVVETGIEFETNSEDPGQNT
jgi:hypothetical protein